MRATAFPLAIPDEDPGAPLPLYVRIGHALADDIRRGRLRAGEALPGSRELAVSLGVHRNTVLAALRELVSEGFLVTEPARGIFVSDHVPEPSPRKAPQRRPGLTAPGFPLPPATIVFPNEPAASSLLFAGGIPDVRLVPRLALARAYRTALLRHGERTLSYVDPRGERPLRAAIASFVARARGLPCTEDEVLVTRGSQMALWLAAQAILAPGDAVAVEALGYRPAWEALRLAGAELLPVPVDANGLDTDALEPLVRRRGVRAVYVTPHHQYPTTVALSQGRRTALLRLAREHGLAILEDDYDHEFHFDGRPLSPLASIDGGGNVLYFGTLSKVVAPGLRVGFVVAPATFVKRLSDLRRVVDRQGDATVELAIADLLEDGTIARHVRRARRIYHRRRDAFVADLLQRFEGSLRFRVPPGGTALYARVDPRIDASAWTIRAAARGLTLLPGARFAFDGVETGALRLGFARLDDDERTRALDLLASAMPPLKGSARRASSPSRRPPPRAPDGARR